MIVPIQNEASLAFVPWGRLLVRGVPLEELMNQPRVLVFPLSEHCTFNPRMVQQLGANLPQSQRVWWGILGVAQGAYLTFALTQLISTNPRAAHRSGCFANAPSSSPVLAYMTGVAPVLESVPSLLVLIAFVRVAIAGEYLFHFQQMELRHIWVHLELVIAGLVVT